MTPKIQMVFIAAALYGIYELAPNQVEKIMDKGPDALWSSLTTPAPQSPHRSNAKFRFPSGPDG